LESAVVSRLNDQLEVPEAGEKEPLSSCTATELMPRESDAVLETVIVPVTVALLVGELIAAEGTAATPAADKEMVGEFDALLATVMLPVTLPVTVGLKATFKVAD